MKFRTKDISRLLEDITSPEQVIGHCSPWFPHWYPYQVPCSVYEDGCYVVTSCGGGGGGGVGEDD